MDSSSALSRHLTLFPPPERSQLLARQANSHIIPNVDDLGAAENELKRHQVLADHRVKVVDDNIAILRTMKAKMHEKRSDRSTPAKLKASQKDKDRDKARRGSIAASSTRAPSSAPSDLGDVDTISLNSATPIASTSAAAARPLKNPLLDVHNSKKKKRRRESQGPDDSDADMLPPPSQKPRKSSPTPSQLSHSHSLPHPTPSTSTHKPKVVTTSGTAKLNAAGFRICEDFSLNNRSNIPARPKVLPPLPRGPRDVTEVNDDFSKWKQPSKQEPVHTFHSFVEPFTRPLREEDLAFLEYNGDQDDPFLIPALGRHYLEVWEDEDAAFEGREPRPGVGPPRPSAPVATNWNQASMTDVDLLSEQHGLGPLTERLVCAVLPNFNQDHLISSRSGGEPKGPDDPIAPFGIDGLKGIPKAPTLPAAELESRFMKELLSLGLVNTGDEPDFTQPEDDQIVSELRTCQRLLRDQMHINHARKARLLEIATDRVAYQEYVDNKEALERSLLAAVAKLSKPKAAPPPPDKKKKKASHSNAPADNGPQPHPSVGGLTLTNDGVLHLPHSLRRLVEVRQAFVDAIGKPIDERERASPGRFYGLPQGSVFESLGLPKDPEPKRGR